MPRALQALQQRMGVRFKRIPGPSDHGGYICEDFLNIVRAILDGSGPISWHFPISGASFEQQVEDMLFGRREWEARDWYRAWEERHRDKSVKPDIPLAADWAGLFQLDMLPRAEDGS
ncbi:hypothetical protein V8F33_005948 [Rhypophila sp. PSN 637]